MTVAWWWLLVAFASGIAVTVLFIWKVSDSALRAVGSILKGVARQ